MRVTKSTPSPRSLRAACRIRPPLRARRRRRCASAPTPAPRRCSTPPSVPAATYLLSLSPYESDKKYPVAPPSPRAGAPLRLLGAPDGAAGQRDQARTPRDPAAPRRGRGKGGGNLLSQSPFAPRPAKRASLGFVGEGRRVGRGTEREIRREGRGLGGNSG